MGPILAPCCVVRAQWADGGSINVCERALKRVVLQRKNALFYETPNGAAEMFTLVSSCVLSEVNPRECLLALLRCGRSGYRRRNAS